MPLIRGNHIGRYFLKKDIEEFCTVTVSNRLHHLKQRIIFQEISNIGLKRRVNCIMSNEFLCGHTTNYLISKNKKISNLLLISIMNSKMINYLFKYFNKTNHVPIGEIKQLPVPNLFNCSQTSFIEKAELMLSLSKEFQLLVQKFIRSIEREFFSFGNGLKPIGEETNEIIVIPKKLQDWYLLSYTEFLQELEKKRKSILSKGFKPLGLSQKAEWEDYFMQESKKVLDLKNIIDATDKAIDTMVYELYGLSEEEILIVEKS